MKTFPEYLFRTLKRASRMEDSIVAVYRKNAKSGEMPLKIGTRKVVRQWIKNREEN